MRQSYRSASAWRKIMARLSLKNTRHRNTAIGEKSVKRRGFRWGRRRR